MNFECFSEEIAAYIREKGYEAKIDTVIKNNGHSLTGVIMSDKGQSVKPIIYLENYYDQFQDGANMEDLVENIVKTYKSTSLDLNMDFFQDYEQVEKCINMKFINFEKNEELLKRVPHKRWHDLAVVFYYPMVLQGQRASILLYDNHLKLWGKTAEEVFQTAKTNMKRDVPVILQNLGEILPLPAGPVPREAPLMYVLSIQGFHYGAAAILYSEEVKDLADKLQCDLLILPSSIHELLILKDDHTREYEEYRMMVQMVNKTDLVPEELLSYSLYRYNREKAEVEMV